LDELPQASDSINTEGPPTTNIEKWLAAHGNLDPNKRMVYGEVLIGRADQSNDILDAKSVELVPGNAVTRRCAIYKCNDICFFRAGLNAHVAVPDAQSDDEIPAPYMPANAIVIEPPQAPRPKPLKLRLLPELHSPNYNRLDNNCYN
jgi:hypothetical protein